MKIKDIEFNGDRGAVNAAVIGVTGALLLATFVPAAALLSAEAAAFAGVYLYKAISKKKATEEQGGNDINKENKNGEQ